MAYSYDFGAIVDEDGDVLTDLDEQVSEEDGLAFAAAPELLASLVACVEALENPGLEHDLVLEEAHRVITKAMEG